jgi:hypothetical protein
LAQPWRRRLTVVAGAALALVLIAAGVVEHCYLTADLSGAYLVVNTADLATAESVMQTLPMAQAGLLQFTFVELAPDQT